MNRPAVQFHVRPGDSLPDNVGTIVNKARELFAWAQQFDPVFKQVGFRKLSVLGVDVVLDNNALAPRIVVGGVSSAKAGGGQSTTLKYRGLAYAASVPDSSSELGEHFRYPYLGTPGNYGTRQTYLSSAVPTSVLTPQGQHVRQTVARLVKRRHETEDPDSPMVYRDALRGILEGGRIQPFIWHPYWVREVTGTGDDTVYHDTDEVWTTAGDIIWCNNKPVAAYYIDGDLPYRAMAFPYKNKVIVIATTGFVGTIPLRSSPRLDTKGLPVFIATDGSTYHPRTNNRSVASSLIPWPGEYIYPAVDQSGTKFAIYNGTGWAKEYTMTQDPETLESSAVETYAVYTTFSYDLPTGWDTPVTTSAASPLVYEFLPGDWPSGGVISQILDNGGGLRVKYDVYTYGEPYAHDDYYETATRQFDVHLSGAYPIALAYVNDGRIAVEATEEAWVTGVDIQSGELQLWDQPLIENPTPPPSGWFMVAGSTVTTVRPIIYDSLGFSINSSVTLTPGFSYTHTYSDSPRYDGGGGPSNRFYIVAQNDRRIDGPLEAGNSTKVSTFAGDIYIQKLRYRYDSYEDVVRVRSRTIVSATPNSAYGFDFIDYSAAAEYLAEHALSFSLTSSEEAREILLLDTHNQVLLYYEQTVVTTCAFSDVRTNVTTLSSGASMPDYYSEEFPAVTTRTARLVLHYGGGQYEHAMDDIVKDTARTATDVAWLLAHPDGPMGALPLAPKGPKFPVMQGMCPYIAYRRPNTENAEMICAYGDKIDNVTPTTYFNAAFTEQGVEDWLTSCGVPSALTTRIATCFRVGGPGPAVTTTETGA